MSRRPVHAVVPLEGGATAAATAIGRFHGDPGAWLPGPAVPIDGGHRVHLSMAGRSPDVPAIVTVGLPLGPRPGLLVRAISWRAETAHDLFPILRADLELHTLDDPTLRLIGSYTPPLSVLGALTDQVVGRRLAAEVLRGFLTDVAHRLVDQTDGRVAADVPSWRSTPGGRGSECPAGKAHGVPVPDPDLDVDHERDPAGPRGGRAGGRSPGR